MDKEIVISIKTVLLTLGLFLSLYVVYRLGPVLAVLLFAALLVMALESLVKYFMGKILMNRPIPRSLAVAFAFAIFIALIIFAFTVVFPPVLAQARNLIEGLYAQIQRFSGMGVLPDISSLVPQISTVSGSVLFATYSIFSNIFTVLSILFIALYMSLDWINIKQRFVSFFSDDVGEDVKEVIEEVELNIGHWIKGQLFLMLVVGSMSFLGLLVIGVDYPLALGLLSGLLEFVPVLGPIVATFLAAVVGFSASPIKGAAAILLFLIIQQTENNFLVPKVMQKVSGFSPLIILLALLIGSNFFGVAGAIAAVPVTMILAIVLRRVLRRM